MLTESDGKNIPEAKDAPVECWQSRQWQIKMRVGSAVMVWRTCPQRQPPAMLAMFFP
jgi:hypothetical protein